MHAATKNKPLRGIPVHTMVYRPAHCPLPTAHCQMNKNLIQFTLQRIQHYHLNDFFVRGAGRGQGAGRLSRPDRGGRDDCSVVRPEPFLS